MRSVVAIVGLVALVCGAASASDNMSMGNMTHEGMAGAGASGMAMGALFDSGNLSAGRTFSWVANVTGAIPYHCHLHPMPSMTGSINVTAGDAMGKVVHVEIKDYGFHLANLTVVEGTTIVWTNNDTVAHTVTSGTHEGMAMGGMGDMAMPSSSPPPASSTPASSTPTSATSTAEVKTPEVGALAAAVALAALALVAGRRS